MPWVTALDSHKVRHGLWRWVNTALLGDYASYFRCGEPRFTDKIDGPNEVLTCIECMSYKD